MINPIKFLLTPLADKLRNRAYLLSYPKSGRTWLLNVFINYLWRKEHGVIEPLEMIYNQRSMHGKKLNKHGIIFTHGFRLYMDSEHMIRTLKKDRYVNRKACIVIRNPSRTLYSYYVHIFNHEPTKEEFIEFLHNHPKGIGHFCDYYNYLLPHFIDNERKNKKIVFYENLNEKNNNHKKYFSELFEFYFGQDLCHESLNWAIMHCYFVNLKKRADEKRMNKTKTVRRFPRVREGNTEIQKGELIEDLNDEISINLMKSMDKRVFKIFDKNYYNSVG